MARERRPQHITAPIAANCAAFWACPRCSRGRWTGMLFSRVCNASHQMKMGRPVRAERIVALPVRLVGCVRRLDIWRSTYSSLLRLALLDPALEQLDAFRRPGTVTRHGAILQALGDRS